MRHREKKANSLVFEKDFINYMVGDLFLKDG